MVDQSHQTRNQGPWLAASLQSITGRNLQSNLRTRAGIPSQEFKLL